jgi:hypothetical protein
MDDIQQELVLEMQKLLRQKQGMIDYLNLKLSQEDWHGVADAAMDIREIVSKEIAIGKVLEKL